MGCRSRYAPRVVVISSGVGYWEKSRANGQKVIPDQSRTGWSNVGVARSHWPGSLLPAATPAGSLDGALWSGSNLGNRFDDRLGRRLAPREDHLVDVFISYANADREQVGSLARALVDHGLSVWWDRQIPPGRTFDEVIEEALDGAKAVIAVWTENGIKSRWVRTEAAEGLARGILVPVTMGKVRPPLAFRRIQSADLSDWEPRHDHAGFTQLVAVLDDLTGAIPIAESDRSGPREDPDALTIRAAERRAENEDWEGVVDLLGALEAENPGFGDDHLEADRLLVFARRKRDAARVYEEAEVLYADGQWAEAVDRIGRVLEIDPDMAYGSDLKAKAERQIGEERNERLAHKYKLATEALESREWSVAVGRFEQLLNEAPNYSDATDQLARARVGFASEQDDRSFGISMKESKRPSTATTEEFGLAVPEGALEPPSEATAETGDLEEGNVPAAKARETIDISISTPGVGSRSPVEDVSPFVIEAIRNGRTAPPEDTRMMLRRRGPFLVVVGGALLVLASIVIGVVMLVPSLRSGESPISVAETAEEVGAASNLTGSEALEVAPITQPLSNIEASIGYVSYLPGNFQVYLMGSDGSNPIRISNNSGTDDEPTASPDGKLIAFTRRIDTDQQDESDIYRVDTDGSNEVDLTHAPGRDLEPAWSPDGQMIAFASDREGTIPSGSECGCPNLDIWLMDEDGSSSENLTKSDAYNSEPAWSPNGDRIAFTSDRHGDRDDNDIYVMDLNGVVLNRFPMAGHQGDAAWSPDGHQIAFTSDHTGNEEIFLIDIETLRTTQLTDSPGKDDDAAWSRDGTQIAFTSQREPYTKNGIYLMNADGSDQLRLSVSDVWEADPTWVLLP